MTTRFLLLFVLLGIQPIPLQAEKTEPRACPGVVVFDRWDACSLSNGSEITYVSERIQEETFRNFAGRRLIIHARKIKQSVPDGDICITKTAIRSGTVPPDRPDSIRLKATPELKPGQGLKVLVSVENTGHEEVDISDKHLGFTLLMKKPENAKLAELVPSDGPSFALAHQPLASIDPGVSRDGTTAGIDYSWQVDNRLPQRLPAGKSQSVRIELEIPAGEYDFYAGYGAEDEAVISNRVAIDVDKNGQARTVTDNEIRVRQWDRMVDRQISAYKAIKDPKPVAFPEMGERLKTLFRSHSLSHVQIFIERDGQERQLSTDLYFGQGELHVVQHLDGWNLVSKGAEAYEWQHRHSVGEINTAPTRELVAYTIYLTDPALFATSLYGMYLRKPELFEPPQPGEFGCRKLRLKKPFHSFTEIHVDLKQSWCGAFAGFQGKSGKKFKYIFSKPKQIKKIPDHVLDRIKQVKFRKGNSSLSRHRTYL